MRRLSLPLEEYQKDLSEARRKGQREAMRRFFLILEQTKKDPKDAVTMIVEEFEGDQIQIDRVLLNLGLMDVAQKMWGSM